MTQLDLFAEPADAPTVTPMTNDEAIDHIYDTARAGRQRGTLRTSAQILRILGATGKARRLAAIERDAPELRYKARPAGPAHRPVGKSAQYA